MIIRKKENSKEYTIEFQHDMQDHEIKKYLNINKNRVFVKKVKHKSGRVSTIFETVSKNATGLTNFDNIKFENRSG